MNRGIPFGRPDTGNERLNEWLDRLYLGVQDWLELPFPTSSNDVLKGNPATSRRCEWGPGGSGECACDDEIAALQAQIDTMQAQIILLGGGGVPDPGLTPSYSNPDGDGDRTATITVTTSTDLFNNVGVDYRFVDGSFFFDNYFDTVADASEHWIRFDFGVPVFITEARWYQLSTSGDNGTWQWQGSNDGSTWASIGSAFVLDTALNVTGTPYDYQPLTTLASNVFLWRYYRMKGVSGSWSPSSYVFEVEFKIDR